jgi:hypothetical protein
MKHLKSLVLIFTLVLPNIAFAQPSIVFDELSHDFGEVEQGEQLEYAFVFWNEGTEELVIEELKPS